MRMQRSLLGFVAFCALMAVGATAWADETTVAPVSNDFMNVHIGGASPTTQFTISFLDEAPFGSNLDVNTITNNGAAGCVDYTLSPPSGDPAYQNLPEAGILVTVTFTPSARGSRPCIFTINDDRDGNADIFTVAGVGTSPLMTTSVSGQDFGSAHVGVASATTRTVTINNTAGGNENLLWSAVMSGAHPGDFAITGGTCPGTCSGSLAPGVSIVLTVTFTPGARNSRTATITVSGNDTSPGSANPSDPYAYTGIGTMPNMAVSPTTLTFSSHVTDPATNQTFTITNTSASTGDETLTYTIAKNGGGSPDFTFGCVPACGTAIPAGSTTTVTVSYTPTTRGAAVATSILVTGTNTTVAAVTVTLNGTGTSPIMVVSETDRNFGSRHIGGAAPTLTFTISNTNANPGNETLVYTIVKTGALDFGIGCAPIACNANIGAGLSTTVTVTYTPALPRGAVAGLLTITGNDTVTPTALVNLTGTGTLPALTVTAVGGGVLTVPIACGTAAVNGGTTMCTFQINNLAPSNEILDYTVGTSNGAEFGVSSASGMVGITGTLTITITFDPTASGSRSSMITVGGDDSGNVSFLVNGTGTVPTIGTIVPGMTVNLPNTDITVAPTTTSSPATTISIANTGLANLNIESVTRVGGNLAQFAIASGMTGAHFITPTNPDSWTVTCTPVTPFGLKTTTFRIISDAPAGVPGTATDFTLNCTGLQASFTFAPVGGLAFGSIPELTSSTLSVTITNNGNRAADLPAGGIVSGAAVYTFAIPAGGPLPRTIAASGGTLGVDVTFTPINGNTTNTNLTVTTSTLAAVPLSFNIPLTGDGIHTGVDIAITGEPDSDVDLGDVRVQTTVGRFVTVTNSSDVPITLQAPSSNDADCVVAPVVPATYPTVRPAGGTATFNINTTPSAVGGGTCVISITSSIPSTDTINVSYNGIAPEMTLLAPGAGEPLDFAGVDVDVAPVQLPVQLQNTGTVALAITSCVISGAQAAKFTVPACSLTVPIGESTIIMVTYDPDIEAVDGALLTLNTDSFPTATAVVDLEGVGLDQHINLPALTYDFPDTFRNPDDPPVQMIMVESPGSATGAPLNISMAVTEVSLEDVFVVTDAGPFVVAPGEDVGIPVEFRPTAYAPFSGVVTIFNDTTGLPMAQVMVTGRGISRNVMVSPGNIDIGLTGVNIPIRLSDVVVGGLSVANIDPDDLEYTVRELQLVDADGDPVTGSPFVLDAPAGQVLGADGSLSYDAEFTATEEGEFDVIIAVYLDNDPEAHALIPMRGTAVEVEVRGGGCQAGGGAGTGGLVVMALGLLALPWKRRRGAALLAAALLIAGVWFSGGTAAADPTRNIELTTFSPPPATEVGSFAVEGASVGVDGAWAIDFAFSYATNVLMVTSPSAAAAGMDPDVPVAVRTGVQLGFAYAFLERFEAGLRVPIYQQSGSAPQFSGLAPAEGTAFGDVALHAKANLLDNGSIALGTSIDVSAPTATEGEFAGSDSASAQLRALVGWSSRRVGVNVNGGVLGRKAGDLGNISQGSAVTFGAGTWVRAIDKLWVIGEAFGSSGVGGDGVVQAEGVLGVRYEVARSVGVSLGGGRGLIHGVGSPDLRGFFLLDVAPRARKSEPLVVKIPPKPRDTRDDDGDGVVNADDTCAGDAEDPDEYKDEDGCPEPDNDEDGLLDGDDKCPLEAEDPDGFLDEDGCVDGDNDGDGILDVDDKCPMEAEDPDNYMDSDGCDEVDNDSDGIPDVIDQCALEPETINGNNDDDGCPDNGDSLVMIMPDRIEVFEPVAFTGTTATITKKSANVLGQVAATMRANRDFKRLRVTVHVHPRNGDDQELSDKRAKAVRDWLVNWGIEPERVESRGLGSTRPLVKKTQKGAAAINDRVEFIILEKEAAAD